MRAAGVFRIGNCILTGMSKMIIVTNAFHFVEK